MERDREHGANLCSGGWSPSTKSPSLHPSPTCGVCTNPDCPMGGQAPKRTRAERSSHTHVLPLHVARAAGKRGSHLS